MQVWTELEDRTIRVGEAEVRLCMPRTEHLQSEFQQLQSEGGADCPYWAKLWPAARALAAEISERRDLFQDKYVMEIACGLGLPSLVAAQFAREILCTDISEPALRCVRHSAQSNEIRNLATALFDWNEPMPQPFPDLLLASDIGYDPTTHPALIHLFAEVLNRGTMILLSVPERLAVKPMITALFDFVQQHHSVQVPEPGSPGAISVFHLKKQLR